MNNHEDAVLHSLTPWLRQKGRQLLLEIWSKDARYTEYLFDCSTQLPVCVCRTLFTAAIAAVMSTCDSVKTVLSGAVFTLINASAILRTVDGVSRYEVHGIKWKEWKDARSAEHCGANKMTSNKCFPINLSSTHNVLQQTCRNTRKAPEDSYTWMASGSLQAMFIVCDCFSFELFWAHKCLRSCLHLRVCNRVLVSSWYLSTEGM